MANISLTDIVIFFIVIAIAAFYIQGNGSEVTRVKSSVDGRSYLVRNIQKKQEVADMLARMVAKLDKLINAVHEKHVVAKNGSEELTKAVKQLKRNWNPDEVSEGTEDSNYTSYSVNKGEKIVFCLRSRDKENNLVNENTLMYVAIHELGHLMTDEYGHTKKFWDNFKYLAEEAISMGLYKKVDYKAFPERYCGITIQNSIV